MSQNSTFFKIEFRNFYFSSSSLAKMTWFSVAGLSPGSSSQPCLDVSFSSSSGNLQVGKAKQQLSKYNEYGTKIAAKGGKIKPL